MNKRLVIVLMLLAFSLSLAAGVTVRAQDSLIESVCLVTDTGKVNDGTFNQFANDGAVRATEEFGLDYTFIETQSQADYDANIQTCIDNGYDAIITVGFLIAEATARAAAANPDVYFIGVDQFVFEGPANYVGLQFREDQGGFLAGALAAMMTESNIVGGVYGVDIPPVKKFRNGFEQGAKFINPDITLLGAYIDSFQAPDRGATLAEQMIGEGADVIMGAGGPTGSGGIVAAATRAENPAFVIGVDQDEYFTTFGGGTSPGADRIISSAIKRVDQSVYLGIKALVDGGADFPGGSIFILSAQNDGIGFAPPNDAPVPAEVTARMDEILAGLKDGTIWTGVDPAGGDLLPTTLEAAASAGMFNTLVAAVEASGLGLPSGVTVFAPTDDAFAAALEALGLTAEELLADVDLLRAVLAYHVVPMAATSDVVVGMGSGEVPTVNGAPISVEITDSGVVLNGSINVVATDILTREGVIHVIDGVLLPPAS
jgi:basic membrane lipoprotein Med (substrate-binding protein (PBP1-ABC) superfamily)